MSVPPAVLANATLPDGSSADVHLRDGSVLALRPSGSSSDDGASDFHDLRGHLLLTAAADAHAHLDKALTWDAVAPPAGGLMTAVRSFSAFQREASESDILGRARIAALTLVENGTSAVRSHVSLVDGPDPLRAVRALVALRAELAGIAELQLVALSTHASSDEDIAGALHAGADLLGGAPHLSPDPEAQTRRLVELAEQHGVDLDLHVDEDLHDDHTLGLYAGLVRDWPVGRRATAGHCVRLGTLPAAERDVLIDDVVASRMGVVTLPLTNLYLQGRDVEVATPRGLTAVRTLLDRGAMLGAGGDNVRDPFNPLGRSDPFETAMLLVAAAHLTPAEAWGVVSTGSRAVLGLPPAGVQPGQRADLLAVRAGSVGQAVAEAPADRLVFTAGRLVSRRTVIRDVVWSERMPG
jgi:cytosine deaminase